MNGGEKMYYSIIALLFIIIVMFGVIIEQKKKYKFELARKNREIALIMKKCNFFLDTMYMLSIISIIK